MSATQASLTPEANAELLAISSRVGPIHPEQDRRAWEELTRDLALAVERAQLLLAADSGAPVCRRGPDGGVMVAFTDDEAAHAWAQAQHPAAPPSSFMLASDEAPGSEREGRRLWLGLLERAGAVALAVNVAGPVGFVLHPDELRKARPRLMRREPSREPGDQWLDLAARAAERERIRTLLAGIADQLERGAPHDVHLHDQNQLGSLLTAAELQYLSGRVRLARDQVKLGVYQMMSGAIGWGRFGDPYRCIDGLLSAGDELTGLRGRDEAGGEPTTWVDPALHDLRDVLSKVSVGYRDEEVQGCLLG